MDEDFASCGDDFLDVLNDQEEGDENVEAWLIFDVQVEVGN